MATRSLIVDTANFDLEGKSMQISIQIDSAQLKSAETIEGFTLSVSFETLGDPPQFDMQGFEPPPITCSTLDKEWRLFLPPILDL